MVVSEAVGVLFCDQVDSTRLLTAFGDATAEELRHDLIAVLNRAVMTARGDVIKGTGDGLMVVFTGDPADAVQCATLMQRGVARLAARDATSAMALRVGISYGKAILDGGDWFGAAVNLAARLCAAAGPSEILVDSHLVNEAGPLPIWRPETLLALKGFPEQVAARSLVWEPPEIGRRSILQSELTIDGCRPLVGRVAERDSLLSAWAQAQSGSRLIRFVEGEAGVGVTRLLAELGDAAADDGTVLFGACGTGTPALVQMIRWRAGSLTATSLAAEVAAVEEILAGWIPLVGLRLGASEATTVPSAARFEACEVFLSRVASTRSLLLVFDDVHLAGADEIESIAAFASAALPTRCLIVIGYRSSDGIPQGLVGTLLEKLAGTVGVDKVNVAPLAADDVERWVSSALTIGADQNIGDIAASIATETAGFPIAIVGVLDALSATGSTRNLDGVGVDDVVTAIALACPYKGLTPFDSDDRDRFFGRDALIDELFGQVHSGGFIAVVGPSGSGKSSVIRAGLLPRLRSATSPAWETLSFSPGSQPIEAMVSAINRRREASGLLVDTSVPSTDWLRHALGPTGDAAAGQTALFIDQFEECFTLCNDETERATFFDILTGASGVGSTVAVVIAVRGDYYGHLAAHRGLAHAAEANTILVGPMSDVELRATITGPAAAAGLAVEPGLCDVIIGDVAGRPGALPLLSHALLETWRRRRGRTLTLDAYREVGGVNAAIARSADRAFEGLDADQQVILRRLCMRLTNFGESGDDTRRRVPHEELTGLDGDGTAVATIVAVLTQARLVTADDTSVEFAHEALLREWPRLRGWLDDDREELRLVARLRSAVVEWNKGERSDTDLYRGVRLDAATQLDPEHLSESERVFVSASINHRNDERDRERRAHRRLRRLVVSLAIVLVAAVIAATLAVRQSNLTSRQATRADARGLAAEATALASTKVDTALLLAAEGYRRDASLETEGGLLTALNGARYLVGYHRSLPLDGDDIALSPDGKTLAVLTYGGQLLRYDTTTWAPTGEPLVDNVEVPYGLSISPDGRYAAFGSAAGVSVVDLSRGGVLGESLGPANGNYGSFSSDGSTIVTTSQDEPQARVFDVSTGRQVAEVSVDGRFAMAEIRPGKDEMFAAPWGAEPVIQRYGLDGTAIGESVTVDAMQTFLGIGYSKDGTRILVYDNNATGELLDPETLAPIGAPFTVRGSRAGDVSWTPDGTRVALAADDGSIRIILTEDGSIETTVSGLTGAPFIEFLDDDRLLALTNTEAAEYDLRRTTAIGTTSARDQLVYDVIAIDSSTAVLADQAQRIVQLTADLTEGPIDIAPPDFYASALAVTADERTAAIETFTVDDSQQNIVAGFVNIVDLPSGTARQRFEINGPDLARRMVFSPDGTKLAIGTREGSLAVFDSRSGSAIVPITKVDSQSLGALVWSPDGSILYGGGQDGVLRLFDPSSGSVSGEVSLSPTIALTDADMVPGTTLLAVASESGEVYFVDTSTKTQVGESLTSGGTQLQGLAVTPDATRIASISRDGAVRIWDRSSGRAIGPALQAHGVQSTGITYLDDGTHLITGGFDGTIVSWDMTAEEWSSQACALAGRNLSQAEWKQYLPGKTYHGTCPSFPDG